MNRVNMPSIRSIERAIDILLAFSRKKTATIQELAEITKIPHSTVYRILCTLEGKKMVQYNEKTAKYKPGIKLFEFNTLIPHVLDVRQDTEEVLDDLHFKTGQTTNMAVRDNDQIIYIY